MKPVLWLACLLLLSISSCSTKETRTNPYAEVDSLFAEVPDFSGVLLIAEKGKSVYHKSFGYRNLDSREAMDTTSIFEFASLSKQFTSMIIMMLKEEGKLSYDDTVEKFIDHFPYPGITVRHLMTHTSGLPDYHDLMEKYWDKSKVAGNADNIEYLIKYHPPVLFKPGDRYEYSNTGYMLLASIAEKASGFDFISFARTRIFVPLKMTSTDIRSMEEKKLLSNIAWGFIPDTVKHGFMRADSLPQYNYAVYLGNRVGPGRVSGTSSDLLKWDRALYTEKLIKQATLAEAFQPTKLNNDSLSYYGFGWRIETHPSFGRVVRHSGSNPGYKTHLIRYIDKDKTVIMLCNNDHRLFGDLLYSVEKFLASSKGE